MSYSGSSASGGGMAVFSFRAAAKPALICIFQSLLLEKQLTVADSPHAGKSVERD